MANELFARAERVGYNVDQVNSFMEQARRQYLDATVEIFTVKAVRESRFDLEKHGYSISAVDSAMEKLEDIFAQRELERQLARFGYGQFVADSTELRELLGSRVNRKAKKKFARRRWPNQGYNCKEVDRLCSQLATHLAGTSRLTAKDVRLSVFKTKRGGYAEHQVDAFIDKIVELIQREGIIGQTSR